MKASGNAQRRWRHMKRRCCFGNGQARRMEVYIIDEDKFYTISGVLIER